GVVPLSARRGGLGGGPFQLRWTERLPRGVRLRGAEARGAIWGRLRFRPVERWCDAGVSIGETVARDQSRRSTRRRVRERPPRSKERMDRSFAYPRLGRSGCGVGPDASRSVALAAGQF